ncbi:hypothetical protein L7F22_042961 [Adiantum nelumboides]|nr:hypothetical protein [Adiantum nelumboides]
MQLLLSVQQGYGSRDASFPVRLANPRVLGDPVLGFPAIDGREHPSITAHLSVSMAMASEDVWHANLQDTNTGSLPNFLHLRSHHGQSQNSASLPPLEDEGALNREIQTLCSLGRPDMALDFLPRAEERALLISYTSYKSLFRTCSSYRDVKKLQVHLRRRNLDLSFSLGELLVVALIKCGSIQDALQVFHALAQRTVFSWSAVLSHYADCSNNSEVLRLYGCMQEEGVEPNEYTYVALFKACGSIPDLQRGIAFHAEARTRGLESSPFVANTLVSMYGKCGMIGDAENVFFGMHGRNLVSWNAMISAYVENGQPDNALQMYKKMEKHGVNPNNRTFLFALQACCLVADKEEAIPVNNKLLKAIIVQGVHKDICLRGFESDIFVGNALMKAYSKCGFVVESQGVFCDLPERNVVTWNTLLSVFVEHGRGEKALRLYRQMQEEGVTPDERTFVNAVQACCIHSDKEEAFKAGRVPQKLMCLDIGQGLHADATKMGFASNVFLGNTLVALYGKCGSLLEAENVLAGLSQRDIVSWTAMLSGYVEQGKAVDALLLYAGMYEEGMTPDEQTIAISLHACCLLSEIEEGSFQEGILLTQICFQLGQAFYLDGKSLGVSSDRFIISNLVNLYGKCGYVAEAEMIFCESFHKAAISWNMMLATYIEQGKPEKALELYRQMRDEGVNPDERTYLIALQACCALAEIEAAVGTEDTCRLAAVLEIGRSLHSEVRKRGLGADPYIRSALDNLYRKMRAYQGNRECF